MAESLITATLNIEVFKTQLTELSLEGAVTTLVDESSRVVEAMLEKTNPKIGPTEISLGLMLDGLMTRVEDSHPLPWPSGSRLFSSDRVPVGFSNEPQVVKNAARKVRTPAINRAAIAEHYLFTLESKLGKLTPDWAMTFAAYAVGFGSETELAITRARSLFS